MRTCASVILIYVVLAPSYPSCLLLRVNTAKLQDANYIVKSNEIWNPQYMVRDHTIGGRGPAPSALRTDRPGTIPLGGGGPAPSALGAYIHVHVFVFFVTYISS